MYGRRAPKGELLKYAKYVKYVRYIRVSLKLPSAFLLWVFFLQYIRNARNCALVRREN